MVYLVGAGPGDPGLITVRGAECIKRADVILYDYLVNPRVLQWARANAVCECLGSHGKRSRMWGQKEINDYMVRLAKEGKQVVRLKNGDPAVFGRQGEELTALVDAGVAFEIVPGVTAALAASSYSGIPITHRDWSSAVALITAQEGEDKNGDALDYEAIARFPGTLAFYMGVTTASHWTQALLRAGKAPDTPAAIIRRCSWAEQQTILCTLAEVAQRIKDAGLRPPVIVFVGSVARLSPQFMWFENRPLFGRRILVTRPKDQATELCDRLEELGAAVDIQPAIRIEPPETWEEVDRSQDQLDRFDWIVFSSANGVRYYLDRLFERGRDLRSLGSVRVAAIGPGTAKHLEAYRVRPDLLPPSFRAEALAETLAPVAREQRFLLVRASRGREVLAEQLRAAGAEVTQAVAYRSLDVQRPEGRIAEQLEGGQIDYITVTSSAIAQSVVRMFGDMLKKTRLVSISPITSKTLNDLGWTPAAEAQVYTMEGVVDAIVRDAAATGGKDRMA